MHEYLKFFGTNNQQETVRFLIYERDLISNYYAVDIMLQDKKQAELLKNTQIAYFKAVFWYPLYCAYHCCSVGSGQFDSCCIYLL